MKVASECVLSLCLAFAALFAALPPDRASAQSRDRLDRRMVIVNETGRVIGSFHATNTGVAVWGPDRLTSDIHPGQRYLIDIDDGSGYCMFDFRAVLDDGRAVEQYRVNVCEYATWTVR